MARGKNENAQINMNDDYDEVNPDVMPKSVLLCGILLISIIAILATLVVQEYLRKTDGMVPHIVMSTPPPAPAPTMQDGTSGNDETSTRRASQGSFRIDYFPEVPP
mmetsp:Transcript_53255/g.64218  ORF Transcript_53255/g.64218 Transcript_53255/m.64218 type:complete len:106 (+) Transcript_53255:231-548(+)